MTNVSSLFRSLLIYSVCVPLAVVLGYLAAQPIDYTTIGILVPVLLLLLVPVLLRWHHTWLIVTWNSTLALFFLHVSAWAALVWISLLISVLQYTLNRKLKFLSAGPVVKPLVLLLLIIVVTAYFRGGIGLKLLGGSMAGGAAYLNIFCACGGFFALIARRIPPEKAIFFVGLFFAGQATIALSELSAVVGPNFYFIFMFLPPAGNLGTSVNDPIGGLGGGGLARLGCLATASSAVLWVMLARYGIGRILSWRYLGRFLIFMLMVLISLLGGFRSILLFFLLTFAILFCFEGLVRKPLLPILLLLLLLGGSVLVPFIGHLPLTVQRTLSFLPIPIDPMAQASADATTEWRVQMWKNVLPLVPQYLWLGKGLAINANELANVSMESGSYGAELAGDYHSGPLSLIIPFGIFGVIAFVWLLIAGLKVLRHNYLHGNPAFLTINRFLLSFFIAKIIFYIVIFGAFKTDLPFFLGLIGLSICVNGGIAEPERAPVPKLIYNRFKIPPPALRKPVGA
jgi:O-antigen ligase